MIAAAENPWGAYTFALTLISLIASGFNVVLKLRMATQMMEEFQKLRKELADTYQRQDVYDVRDVAIEKRLNRLEGCRGPT